MSSIELTRIGIILTMASILFISPEVFSRARGLSWINTIFERVKYSIKNIRSQTITRMKGGFYSLDVKKQLEEAFETGKFTRLLLRVGVFNSIPLISLVTLILYFYGYFHISIGIIAGVITFLVLFFSVYDVFSAHSLDAKRGKNIPFEQNLEEHVLFPPLIYLTLCIRGFVWPILFTIILLRSKAFRAWLAIFGILIFIAGQTLQLMATFNWLLTSLATDKLS